jgi:ribosome-binding ATPase YchF (GTP1/OBG family)
MVSNAPPAWRPKLRLLCLHGRQQSSAVFEHRIDKLVSKAGSCAEFVFIDGPEELPLQASERVNSRSWGLGEGGNAERATQVIEQAWIEQGPFDGVVGFSEGAIAAYLCCQMPDSSHPNLRFAILAGGPAPWGETKGKTMPLPSLHFASAADSHVPIADSRALAAKFEAATFVEHTGGHCFPQRAEDIQQVVKFLQARRDEIYPDTDAGQTLPFDTGDDQERICPAQLEELETLSVMFTEDEIARVAPAWPVRIVARVAGMQDTYLHFTLPTAYPDTCGCRCEFVTERLDFLTHKQELMAKVEAAREPLGVPSVLSMLQAAKDWTDEHAVAIATGTSTSCTVADGDEDEAGPEAKWWLKEDEVDEAALREAEQKATELIPDLTQSAWARDCGASGFGRPWQFVVGLVGKPSAGKSTFFNAATRPERPDREASMAPHPFTTIDPNVAPGWFGAPCPAERVGCEAQPEHGYVAGRRRKYPLLVKDVAGLVPGAYCGRGRGNAFLNDLVEADSLIHVVDGSGRSDSEGVDQNAGASAGTDPLDEVGWVRREIHLWIFCNVRAKFDSVRRRARMGNLAAQTATQDRFFSLFTGYHASRQLITQVYEAAGFSLHGIAAPTGVLSWQESDLHLMVACFLRVRFPITIALNKIDLPESTVHVPRVCEALGKNCVPTSAGSEWWLWDHQRQGHLTYLEGAGADAVQLHADAPQAVISKWEEIRTKVLQPYGTTGILDALSSAVLQRRPMFTCPVTDFSSYEGLMRAPASGYSTGTKAGAALATMVMLRPLSTVEEVHAALTHEQMLRGDFVRAELLDGTFTGGLSTRVLRRDEVVKSNSGAAGSEQAFVVKILTNKKSTWQSGH